jgi:small-conductance mechanosensitive channel
VPTLPAALAAALLVALPLASAANDAPAPAAHPVKLHGRTVLDVRAPLDGVSAAERARRASEALEAAFAAGARTASVRPAPSGAAVLLGDRPVLTVGPADARAAGLPDPPAAATRAAAEVERTVREEARRAAAQATVFALSMLVFSGLVAFLLARRAGALALAWAERIETGELALPALTAAGVEVTSASFLRGAVPLALRLARFLAWIAAGYAWLLFAATLSERTRPLGARLTRAVIEPAGETLGTVGRSIPLGLALALGVAVLAVVLRAVRLWFDGVARGESTSPWISRANARTTGALVRGALVVLALLAAPGLLGLREEGIGRLGLAALLALGLGATPVAATFLLGVVAVYGGTLRPGDVAEVAGRRGRVVEITLREVVLEDEAGGRVHVPHLVALLHPTRVERRG